MVDPTLRLAVCRSITLRAHIAAAEGNCPRYWRELAAAGVLTGMPWPAAEQLGATPTPQETR